MIDDPQDPLDDAWRNAGRDPTAEAAFLRALSAHRVLVLLRQPPGSGAAAPRDNLVRWRNESTGLVYVPIFTGNAHLTIPVLPPAQETYVAMRVLLGAGGGAHYLVNPLSSPPFELDQTRVRFMRALLTAQGLEAEAPSTDTPWSFRYPDDALYPVAVALVQSFIASGQVDEAYMYELTRGAAPPRTVLGLNLAVDSTLAATLMSVAVDAGIDPDAFEVRFVPEEPSHLAGIESIALEPFYRRSGSS